MDHFSAVTEVFQHAARESTKYIVHYQRRTFKHSLALIIHKRIEKSSYMWICNFSGPSEAIEWHMIKAFQKKMFT